MSRNLIKSRLNLFGLSVVFLLVALCLGTAAYSPKALAATGDTTLSGYVLPQVTNSLAEGKTSLNPLGNHELELSVMLKSQDYEGLQKLAEAIATPGSPQYRHFLTSEEFAARFSPSQADYDAVVTYFKQSGFEITHIYPNRLSLDVKAPAGRVASTLHTNFVGFSENSKQFFSVDRNPTLPAYVAGSIQYITGLTDYYNDKLDQGIHSKGDLEKLLQADNTFRGYGPQQLASAYNATPFYKAGVNGGGTTIGILLFAAYFEQKDLDTFADKYGLPHWTPRIVGNLQDPGNKDLFEPIAAIETLLDLETSHGAAPGANVVLYTASPTDKETSVLTLITKTFQEFVNDNKADVTNGSFGLAESITPPDFVKGSSQLLLQGAVQGTSMFFSSGDNGLFGEARFTRVGGDINKQVAEFPATFPLSTAVGGTRLGVDPDGQIGSEYAWSFNADNDTSEERASTGGGYSDYYLRPFYQTGFHRGLTRAVPDVSANADPDTGYNVVLNAKYIGGPDREVSGAVGGTSGSSPLWTGFTALLIQGLGSGRLGPINGLVYDLNFSVFHDITEGYNGTNAVPGYDVVTGIGSPDLLKLINFLPSRIYESPLPPLATFFERINPNVSVRPGAKVSVIVGVHNYTTGDYSNPSLNVPIPAGLTLVDAHFTQPDAYVQSVNATNAVVNLGKRVAPNNTVTAFLIFQVGSGVASGTLVTHRTTGTWEQNGRGTSYTSNRVDLLVTSESTTDLTQDGFFQGDLKTDSATGDLVLSDTRLGISEPVTLWYNTSKGTTYDIPAGLVSSNGSTDGTGLVTVRLLKGQWTPGQYTLVVYGRTTGTTLLLSFSVGNGGSLTPLSLKVQ